MSVLILLHPLSDLIGLIRKLSCSTTNEILLAVMSAVLKQFMVLMKSSVPSKDIVRRITATVTPSSLSSLSSTEDTSGTLTGTFLGEFKDVLLGVFEGFSDDVEERTRLRRVGQYDITIGYNNKNRTKVRTRLLSCVHILLL